MNHNWQAKEPFRGCVEMDRLSHDQRMEILNDLNLQADSAGEVKINKDMLSKLSKIKEHVNKHVKKVDLEHIDSGMCFKSLTELEYYEEFQEVLNELSGILLNGFKLGNLSKKVSSSKSGGHAKA
jgi:hypothetical protein